MGGGNFLPPMLRPPIPPAGVLPVTCCREAKEPPLPSCCTKFAVKVKFHTSKLEKDCCEESDTRMAPPPLKEPLFERETRDAEIWCLGGFFFPAQKEHQAGAER